MYISAVSATTIQKKKNDFLGNNTKVIFRAKITEDILHIRRTAFS